MSNDEIVSKDGYVQIREIKKIDLINYLLYPFISLLVLITGFVFLLKFVLLNTYIKIISIIIFVILLDIVCRFLLIGFVLLYKAFAPMKVRCECRFEPTCSTYMVICLRKYGCFLGVIKGLLRITRCHYPNGGYDYPDKFFQIHKKGRR